MVWLRGLAVAGGTGLLGWGWWLDRRPAVRLELYRDPDSGALSTATRSGGALPAHSLAVIGLLLLIAVLLNRRGADIRRVLAGWRKRPVAVLASLSSAALMPTTALVVILLYDLKRRVPPGSHLRHLVWADPPFAWFLATLLLVISAFCAVIGPWQVDHLIRLRENERRLRQARERGDWHVPAQLVMELGERVTERPYRKKILVNLLLRYHSELPNAEPAERALHALARVPGLVNRPGWLFRIGPSSAEYGARYLLADAFITRFAHSSARPHLELAIGILEGIHRRPPILVGRRLRPWVALTLAHALAVRHRHEMTADGHDLDRAFQLADGAAALLPPDEREATVQFLGRLLLDRHEENDDRAALDRAVALLGPVRPTPELVFALVIRYQVAGSQDDLTRAVATALAQEAVTDEAAADDIASETALGALLLALVQRPNWWHGPGSDLVTDALARLDALPRLSPGTIQFIAIVKGLSAFQRGDHEAGTRHYEHALTQLAVAASLGLSRADRQRQLSGMITGPDEFAGTLLALGQVERSVELLELGRTVIWSGTRTLRRFVPSPDTEARLAEIRAALDRPGYANPEPDDPLAAHQAAARRAELNAEWEALTAAHGARHRMRYAEIRRAASGGPVVVINVGEARCDAIIVLAEGDPVHVVLPDVDSATVATWTGGLLAPTTRRINARSIARELWDTVAAPVLAAVEPHLGPDRRIWWCPTGPLAAVPLHLAGHHDRTDGPALIDHVVSSYTPSLWALLDARRAQAQAPAAPHPAAPSPAAMLIASLRDTPGQPALPHAEEEALRVAGRCPAARRLTGQEATVREIRAALPTHPWVHIACHGDQGGLVLHDGRLGLDELADMNLTGERLAFLSACVTALPDPRTVDEVLHPAAAFHISGFPQVIGTLWDIVSSDGPTLADDFYRLLLTEGRTPAEALHQAQRRLRAAAPGDPARWAPFVHIGP
ncbi:CHAT domain-containing protein [Streptomyces sp. NBRC 109706]|uniref:CHAT domain-containing protein n=1 Tax=Streptomyces sp. NBRC 109706 TaxID=1550035 RepID=UPI000B231B6B|nr:CHAT domain-containing protein [Streptomyces sp. NBRC 109706]